MNLSRSQIMEEISEKSRDLEVFRIARELIRRRVLEVTESASPLTPLPNWSGTDAVLGSLDLCIHSMERTITELNSMLKDDWNKPLLRIVRDDDESQN